MGQHWLNPPHLMPLCEIIRGEQTQQPYVEQMYQLVKDLGKEPVIVKKDITGFLANRLQYAMLREALYLVEEGAADVEDIDTVLKAGLGLRYAALGPFRVCDFGGLDTGSTSTSMRRCVTARRATPCWRRLSRRDAAASRAALDSTTTPGTRRHRLRRSGTRCILPWPRYSVKKSSEIKMPGRSSGPAGRFFMDESNRQGET